MELIWFVWPENLEFCYDTFYIKFKENFPSNTTSKLCFGDNYNMHISKKTITCTRSFRKIHGYFDYFVVQLNCIFYTYYVFQSSKTHHANDIQLQFFSSPMFLVPQIKDACIIFHQIYVLKKGKPAFPSLGLGSANLTIDRFPVQHHHQTFAPYKQRNVTLSTWIIFNLVSIKIWHHTNINTWTIKLKTHLTWLQNLHYDLACYALHGSVLVKQV